MIESTNSRLEPIRNVTCRTVDVADEECVTAAAAAAHQDMGRIDILVNCAGVAGQVAPVESFPVGEWVRVMRINLDDVFHCCRAVVPHMRKLGYGRIVNIASVAGKEGNPNASAYSVSKASVINLSRCLGKELASKGICVNAITPGVIRTEMLDDISDEQIGYLVSRISMAERVRLMKSPKWH